MKKRFLAILLTVVMVFALAVPASAYIIKETKLDQVWHPDTYENAVPAYHLVKTTHHGLYGYVNYQDYPVVQAKYNTLAGFSEGLAVASKDGSWLYVDPTGKEVITLGRVKEAYNFSCGRARVVTLEGYTYFIDKTGKSVIDCGKNTATDFKEVATGVYLARCTTPAGKIGQINRDGVEVTHFWFDEIRDYACGLAYCRNGKNQGFLNTAGYLQYSAPSTDVMRIGVDVKVGGSHVDYSDNMVIVENINAPVNSRIGYLDKSGYQAVHCQYEEGTDFAGGVARIKRGNYVDSTGAQIVNGYGYIDHFNKYTVQPIYNWLDRGTGIVRAMVNKRDTVAGGPALGLEGNHVIVTNTTTTTAPYDHWGFVNVQNGAVVVELKWTYARPFSDGVAYVENWLAKGFVNTAGVLCVNAACYYDEIGDSHEGKAWVVKNGKWGYISTRNNGALVIPMIFDKDGVKNYPSITMDKNGPTEYKCVDNSKFANFNKGVAVACYGNVLSAGSKNEDNGRYGIIDASGNWLTANAYTWIDDIIYDDYVALARYNGSKIRFVWYR